MELKDQQASACAEAVKACRLSKDCQYRKGQYATGFTRYGFYLAHSYLESQRPGETFPELVFTRETENFEASDWRKYDPLPLSPNSYLQSRLKDNLENLTGPWEPFDFGPGDDNMIEALQDFGVSGDDATCLLLQLRKMRKVKSQTQMLMIKPSFRPFLCVCVCVYSIFLFF